MMLRKISTAMITVCLCAALSSCGSGGSSGASASNSPQSVHGVYYGVLGTTSNPTGINTAGAVGSGGKAYFFSTSKASSNVVVFSSMGATGSVSSQMNNIPSADVGGRTASSNWNMSITEDTTMMQMMNMDMAGMMMMGPGVNMPLVMIAGSGTLPQPNQAILGTLPTVQMGLAYQSFSDSGVSLASIAGNYQGSDLTRLTGASVTVSSTGAISGSDGLGCSITGSLTQEAGKDVFDVSMNLAGTGCAGSMSGVAFTTLADLSGTLSGSAGSFLYIISASGDMSAGSTLEIQLQ